MTDDHNDGWGTTPPPAEESPNSATADQGRPWHSRPALVAALVLVVALLAFAVITGGGADEGVSDVPATDDNALPVEGPESG